VLSGSESKIYLAFYPFESSVKGCCAVDSLGAHFTHFRINMQLKRNSCN